MQIHHSLFLTTLASACARAQNLTSTSVVATASATPSEPGDPTQLSSYPLCAVSQPHLSSCNESACLIESLQQKCNNQSIAAESFQYLNYGCDITQTACVCQPLFRATTAACRTRSMTGFDSDELIIATGEEVVCEMPDYQSIHPRSIYFACCQRISHSTANILVFQRRRH